MAKSLKRKIKEWCVQSSDAGASYYQCTLDAQKLIKELVEREAKLVKTLISAQNGLKSALDFIAEYRPLINKAETGSDTAILSSARVGTARIAVDDIEAILSELGIANKGEV